MQSKIHLYNLYSSLHTITVKLQGKFYFLFYYFVFFFLTFFSDEFFRTTAHVIKMFPPVRGQTQINFSNAGNSEQQ